MLHTKLFDGLKRISAPFRTQNHHRDGARRQRGFRRPRLECLERRELLSVSPGWLITEGGTGEDYATAVATDDVGNVYVTGEFQDTVDFDPGPGSSSLTSLGSDDAFVAKYTSSGALEWVAQIGGAEDSAGRAIAVDDNGDVYVTGDFTGTIDADPGPFSPNQITATISVELDDKQVLIAADGGQLSIVTTQDDDVAERLVIGIPIVVQAMSPSFTADHLAHGRRFPFSKPDFDLVFEFDPILRL